MLMMHKKPAENPALPAAVRMTAGCWPAETETVPQSAVRMYVYTDEDYCGTVSACSVGGPNKHRFADSGLREIAAPPHSGTGWNRRRAPDHNLVFGTFTCRA